LQVLIPDYARIVPKLGMSSCISISNGKSIQRKTVDPSSVDNFMRPPMGRLVDLPSVALVALYDGRIIVCVPIDVGRIGIIDDNVMESERLRCN